MAIRVAGTGVLGYGCFSSAPQHAPHWSRAVRSAWFRTEAPPPAGAHGPSMGDSQRGPSARVFRSGTQRRSSVFTSRSVAAKRARRGAWKFRSSVKAACRTRFGVSPRATSATRTKRARLPHRRASSASGGIVSFSASANALRFAAEVSAPPLAALALAATPSAGDTSPSLPALVAKPTAGESLASFSRSSANEAGESQSETNTIRRSVAARSASVWPWPTDLATSDDGKAGAAAAAMTPMNSHMNVPALTG